MAAEGLPSRGRQQARDGSETATVRDRWRGAGGARSAGPGAEGALDLGARGTHDHDVGGKPEGDQGPTTNRQVE